MKASTDKNRMQKALPPSEVSSSETSDDDQSEALPTKKSRKKYATPAATVGRKIFGRNLRTARKAANIKQVEICQLLGINQGYLSDVERGLVNIGLDYMWTLAGVVSKPLHELLKP